MRVIYTSVWNFMEYKKRGEGGENKIPGLDFQGTLISLHGISLFNHPMFSCTSLRTPFFRLPNVAKYDLRFYDVKLTQI